MANSKVSLNYVYNLAYQILNIVIPLVTIPYLSRVLGADGIGTVSYAESVVAYFTLFASMGISIYGQREISYVQEYKEERSRVFWETKLLTLATSGAALMIYLLFWRRQEERLLYGILALNILAVAADVSWFFQGMEEFKKTVTRSLLFRILNLLYIFTFVKTDEDIIHYTFALAFFTFAGNSSLWWDIREYVEKPIWSELRPFRNFKVVFSLFIPTIAIQVYTVLDKTMIGLITNDSFENGYYEMAMRMSKLVLVVVTALGTVMVPRIGQHFQKQETETIKELMYKSYRFVWFLGFPLTFGLIGVSGNFVPWFFGEGYLPVVSLLQILAFLILAIGISNVTGIQYLVPTKRQHLLTYSVVIGAGLNFCMNLLLIPKHGALGAAVASLAAEVAVTVVQLFFVRKELKIKTIIGSTYKYLMAAGIMFLLLKTETRYLSPNFISIAIMVLSGAITYFGVLVILQDEFFNEGITKSLIMMKKLVNVYLSIGERVGKYTDSVNIIFYITYSLYYFRLFISTTTFDLPWTIWMYRVSLPLVAIIAAFRLLTIRKDDWKEVLVVVLLICSSFINGILYGDVSVFVFSMFILAAKDADFKRIVQISVGIGTMLMVAAYWCSQNGMIEDYVYWGNKFKGEMHSFGIIFTTDFMAHVFFLVLGIFYLLKGRINFVFGITVLLGNFMLYNKTGARTNFLCICLVVLFSWWYQFYIRVEGYKKIWGRCFEWIMNYSCLLAGVFMVLATYLYNPSNLFLEKINRIITNRLGLGKQGFSDYGIKVFGQFVEMNGLGNGLVGNPEYFYLDCSYVNILLRNGVLVFALILLLIVITCKKLLEAEKYTVLLLGVIALQCMIEHHLIEGAYNYFVLLCLSKVSSEGNYEGNQDSQ